MQQQVTSTPWRPLEEVATDIVELPACTEARDDYLMTITDTPTKHVTLIPFRKSQSAAKTVAERFLARFACTFGVPERVISDKDPRFKGRFWSTFTKTVGIKNHFTTPRNLAADGQSEVTNRKVLQQLRGQKRWTAVLPLAKFQLNTTPSVSTGYTPFQLLFGREAPCALRLAMEEVVQTPSRSFHEFWERCRRLRALAARRLHVAKRSSDRAHNE